MELSYNYQEQKAELMKFMHVKPRRKCPAQLFCLRLLSPNGCPSRADHNVSGSRQGLLILASCALMVQGAGRRVSGVQSVLAVFCRWAQGPRPCVAHADSCPRKTLSPSYSVLMCLFVFSKHAGMRSAGTEGPCGSF